jgi:NADH:ubiquinone oxidoreductase subunit F (NADH-binding)
VTAEPLALVRPVPRNAARWNRAAMALGALDVPAALVVDRVTRETLDEYARPGGVSGRALIDAVEHAELRGRGGAAFPTGVKMRAVADRDGTRTVVANGDEGEPLAVKDRYLLRIRPHLVLDGLLRAAGAVDADRAVVYLSDDVAADSVRRALAELGATAVPVDVVQVPRTYVGGEESAVVRAIDGGPALPTDKPPRPFESGVGGGPTLVLNVETLARIPAIAAGEGSDTVLLSLSGAVARSGLYEVPHGVQLGELLERVGGARGEPSGFLMGGYFAGLLGPRALAIPFGFTELRAEGSGLGCGAVAVLGLGDCPVAAAADVMAYFDRENARQCGPCIRGTAAMAEALRELADGTAADARLEKLHSWSVSLHGRGACATLDGACNVASSLLREFPDLVDAHRAGPCARCAARTAGDRAAPTIDCHEEASA